MKKVFQTISIFFILFLPNICFADKAEDLQKLNDLFKQDILTEEQYNQGVEKILKDEDLQKLKDLYEQGILTQEQYNAGVEKILKNIEKILKDSEEMKKLTELLEGGILTEEQFKEGKQKVLQKIETNNDVTIFAESQQSEASLLDGLYNMEVEWIWISYRVNEVRVGDKAKFALEIKNNEVKSLIALDETTGLVDKELKFFSYRFTNKGNKKFKLHTSVMLKSDPNESINSKWVLEIIDKKFHGTLTVSKGADPLLKGNIIYTN